MDVGWVRRGALEAKRLLIEAVHVKRDLEAEVLLGGEIPQQLEVDDALLRRLVGQDVVDARGSRAARDSVPVLASGVGGGSVVGVPLGDVSPPVLEQMDKDGVGRDVDVGVHTQEVWRITHARGSGSSVAKEL